MTGESVRARAEEAERFLGAAREIVEEAERRSIVLRLLGSLAYRVRCPVNAHLLDEMQRVLTDLDFASERRYAKEIDAFLHELGYIPDLEIATATGGERYFFKHPETALGVDVFMDKLDYCHPIPFKGRLTLDARTIPLAELLLEKMQIVEINPKDIKDSLVLLLEHTVDSAGAETIDGPYIAALLSGDWGFYYTVTRNLEKLRHHVADYGALDAGQWEIVSRRISELEKLIEEEPKTRGWKIRARIGPRVKWYQDVAEKSATF